MYKYPSHLLHYCKQSQQNSWRSEPLAPSAQMCTHLRCKKTIQINIKTCRGNAYSYRDIRATNLAPIG